MTADNGDGRLNSELSKHPTRDQDAARPPEYREIVQFAVCGRCVSGIGLYVLTVSIFESAFMISASFPERCEQSFRAALLGMLNQRLSPLSFFFCNARASSYIQQQRLLAAICRGR